MSEETTEKIPAKEEIIPPLRRRRQFIAGGFVFSSVAILILLKSEYRNAIFEFIAFEWHCVHVGWEIGDGVFGVIEKLCLFTSIGLGCFKTVKREKWKKWEDILMKAALLIFVGLFVITTFFVAQFV